MTPHHERQDEYEAMSRAALEAMDAMAVTARRLAAEEWEERSPNGRVTVRVTAAGDVTSVTFRLGTLQRYGVATLGTLIARTIRAGQVHAKEEYDRKVDAAVPDTVVESQRVVRSAMEGGHGG